MLSLEDKEFVRMWIEDHPVVLGSHLRAVKAAIALKRLLNIAEKSGPIDLEQVGLRRLTLGLHETGKEYTPSDVEQLVDVYNYAVEVARG